MNNVIERCPRCGYYVAGVKKNQFVKLFASIMFGNSMANTFGNQFMRYPYTKLAYDDMSKNDRYTFNCPCGCQWESDGRGTSYR